MARTKSTKVNKVSYAERVLGALTQVQKEHRKSSVHMATLRAQIKRNAEAKNDNLGPQWSHWVTKAVHKLMEEGVLSMNDQSVFLTVEGKNTMSVAKKSVRHLPDAEDRVIKNAVILASPSLSKRRRSVYAAAGLPPDDDESASAAPPPRKRARKSNATSTAGKLTTGATATSITPVRRGRPPRKSTLATVTNAPASRDVSPLTDVEDLDAEENERLKKAIEGKDQEILTLKMKLYDATSAHPPNLGSRNRDDDSDEDAQGEEDEDDQVQRQLAIHVTDADTPTRSRPDAAQAKPLILAARNQDLGLARTGSGTIIPHMSKRPTPAPSEGEQTEPDDQDMPPAFHLPSPGATPAASFEDDVFGNQSGLHAHDEVEQTHRESVQELADQLDDSNGKVETLTRELERLMEEDGRLRDDLQAQRTAIADLSSELHQANESGREAALALQERLDEIPTLKASRRDLEEQIATTFEERQAARMERDALKEELRVVRSELEAESGKTVGLTERLQMVETTLEQRRDELGAASAQVDELTTELEETKTAAECTRSDLDDARRALDQERQTATDMGRSLQEKNRSIQLLQEENSSLTADLGNLRREVQEKQDLLEATRGAIRKEATQRQALETEIKSTSVELDSAKSLLEAEKKEATTLRGSVGGFEVLVRDLQAQVSGANAKLEDVERSKVDQETKHVEEVQRLQKTVAMLEERSGAMKSELDEVNRRASQAEMEREELRALNVILGTEKLALEIELEGERSRIGELEREAAAKVAKESALTSELESVRTSWENAQRELQEARLTLEKARKASIGVWEQLDKEQVARAG